MTSRKKKPKTARPAKLPTSIMVLYRKRLIRVVARMKAPVLALVVGYEKELAKKTTRGDAVVPERGRRSDASAITRIVGGLGVELDTIVRKVRPNLLAQEVGKKTQAFTLEEVDKSLKGSWRGVPTIKPDKTVAARDLTRFVRDNVALIKSVPKQLHAQVRAEVEEAWSVGRDPAVLRARLIERVGVAESRARLIAKDQVQKLHSVVTEHRHKELGVESYIWSTAKDERVRGNPAGLYPDARPSHFDREGQVFRYDDPPEDGPPGIPINCIPGDVTVSFHAHTLKAYRRRYSGELTEIVADSGESVRCTPNHPVLTTRGWLPAHLVEVGDNLLEVPAQGIDLDVGNPQSRDPKAEEVFRALSAFGVTHRVPGATARFHGDAVDEEVSIVEVDRGLLLDCVTKAAQVGGNDGLPIAAQTTLAQGISASLVVALATAADSIVGSGRESGAVFDAGFRHADEHRLAAIARVHACLSQDQVDRSARDAARGVSGCEGLDALAIAERRNDLIRREVKTIVRHPSWSGDVFNFETETGWFGAHGLIIHNCRCVALPIIPDDIPDDEEAA